MIKILITGGAGNVGSSLADFLSNDNSNQIVIFDNLLTGSLSKLPSTNKTNWKFIKGDVNNYKDISAVMTSNHFDYVFHYAAVVGVKRTTDNPKMVLDDIEGIKNVLDLAKNTGVKRVFYSSSSEVYGEPVEMPQNEDTTPLNSKLPYAIVKNLGEAFLKSYNKEYGLNYTIFRFFNTYGPNQSTDFVMAKFIAGALKNKDITIYGDGSQTRTFCYIDDNLAATSSIMYNNYYINDVVNIGSDIEYTIRELAEKVINITKSKSKIIHLPPLKEGDMTRRQPDISKMKKILQKDLLILDEGIKKMITFGKWK
jgi:nucleoside-diphosphate-sugar epimerase